MQNENSRLCVGLDPRADSVEEADALCRMLINATIEHAACYKPNSAFFEAFGGQGFSNLEKLIKYIHDLGSLVILDCKRGDIGSTADSYAKAAYNYLEADLRDFIAFSWIRLYKAVCQ